MQLSRFVVVLLLCAISLFAQTPTATINGRVLDPSHAVIDAATVQAINIDTNARYSAETNASGLFTIVNLPPGNYRIEVAKPGFRTIVKPGVVLHVQDVIGLNFDMSVGSISESVTVEGGAPLVNTQDATVSTVVDRNFAENLPMNGRSFQTLIELTPGVIPAVTNGSDSGQFNVNGQRASSNYWMVDGVSANIGISAFNSPGNGLAGALGSFSVLGGTNSLVSVDALEEFRIQTSTFAPEFGRVPGGQISIITRSGTNQFHGTLFDYLRNDVLDATNWFNGAVTPPLPKAKERQNDFGGTLSGPISKDRMFFFFSYEGLRLRLPQTELTNVPDAAARQAAVPALQPFLNAYPQSNGADDPTSGIAQFNASFSDPASLDAYSLRLDYKLKNKLNFFARYDYSPSELSQRGFTGATSLSSVSLARVTTQTGTVGVTWSSTALSANDLRFNVSNTNASDRFRQDNFGGAVPLTALPFPGSFTAENANLAFQILSLGSTSGGSLVEGENAHNRQQQINITDTFSWQKASHGIKFGIDFRRLSPEFATAAYTQQPVFLDVSGAESGNLLALLLQSTRQATMSFRNFGAFVQDTWRATPRLTLTYGLRWDIDFAPSAINGPGLEAVTGFNLRDLSQLALAPSGTPPFQTKYNNVAPRLGLAYELSTSQKWQAVLRGGVGTFYDLATAEAGNVVSFFAYPFGAFNVLPGPVLGGAASFPNPSQATPPAIVPPNATNGQTLFAFDPGLRLPYALQWNVAFEQALGRQQSLTVSYLGSSGRRLLQTAFVFNTNPNFGAADLVTNAGMSNYNALQVQFQRRLSHGLQVLASHSWSHSIDTASASSLGSGSNELVAALSPRSTRGPSDFDVRNVFSVGLTYDVLVHANSALTNALFADWSFQSVIQARSAGPVNVIDSKFIEFANAFASIRPDVVAGQPLYLFGGQFPGGKALNPAAFTDPPADPNTGIPLRQGNLGRNALRGFGATQWDLGIHRDFPIHESLKLQFRTELFNVLNHPNFGPPVSDLSNVTQFGRATQMLGQSLAGSNLGSGALDPLYQVGGPRSVQFALKLLF